MTDQNQRLQDHLQYAYDHAPAVKKIFDDAGLSPSDIKTVEDLVKLPVTSKSDFSAMQQVNPPFGGWLAVPLDTLERIYISPGPIYDPHGAGTEAITEDATTTLKSAGFGPSDIVINAFLYHMVPAGLWFDESLRRTGATVVPIGPGNTEVHVKVMLDLGVTGYAGTPSFLAIILDKIESMNIPKEALKLNKAFFSAEPYPSSLRARFEGEYGMKTHQAYATADLGVIAYQPHGSENFIIPENQVVELVDPETGARVEDGTPGEVVVSKFDRTYPLLRFGTGDMALMAPGTGQLRGLVGRTGEAVKVRGMFLHPNQLHFVANNMPNVEQIQAIITREGPRDHVTLNVVVSGDVDVEMLKGAIQQAARLSVNDVQMVEKLEDGGVIADRRTWD